MRYITISMLSVLMALPTVAMARMPVVNLSSGGISARSAFGEDTASKVARADTSKVASNATTRTRTVKARPTVAKTSAPVDAGGRIVAANTDVLSPRRPSADLWAHGGARQSDAALRMPSPAEFSVIRSDSLLPEESLDNAPAVASRAETPVTKSVAVARDSDAELASLDAQIARLQEMQRRAEQSVRATAPRVIAPTVDAAPVTVAAADPVPAVNSESDGGVSLRRLVVPMADEDVVFRAVEKNKSPRIASVRDDMTKMNPSELRKAFRKTFLSENKHLSTYSIDSRFDEVSDMSSSIEGFTAARDISEGSGIRPLEIKIKFRDEDSALSRENYTLLTEYAGIVVNKPTRAIQVAIPQYMTQNSSERKLAARRLAIVEQVLTDNGVSQQRIVPVLSQRQEQGFVLRIISSDQYESLTQQSRDIFGDTVGKKTYKSMSW